jgi:formylglycine-generating enzyme required for sulfatase activity
VPELDLVMLPLAAGTFVMGQPQGTASNSPDESPPTRVVFTKPFWLGATEVTVGQWRHFTAATSYRTEAEKSGGLFVAKDTAEGAMAGWEQRAGLNWQNPGRPQEDRQPVVGISWNDAVAFCAWLTEREKKSGRLPAGYAYALPTEAQWEYACRAGNRGPDPENLDALAWHAGNSADALHPVGLKQPNLWGFFDLQGNVAEWCFDWYGPYPGGTVTDPTGPRDGTVRVNRGGSARSAAGYGISATNRGSNPAPPQRDDLGFRVALTPVR